MADVFARLYAGQSGPATSFEPPSWLAAIADRLVLNADSLIAGVAWYAISPVVSALAWLLFGLGAAVAVAAAMWIVPVVVIVRLSGRRDRLLVSALPAVVDIIARSLRSGASFHQALAEVTEGAPAVIRPELQQVLAAIEFGQPASDSLREWAQRVPLPEVRIVAAALALASEHETGMTRALDGVSQTLRDRTALTAEISGLTAQASSSMRALVLLPAGFLSLDLIGDQAAVRYLLTQSFGQLCLIGGTALNLFGALWMRIIVRRQLPA